jgi:hypothetical protein
MMWRALCLVAVIGCGDNLKATGDGGGDTGTDTPPAATFTSFVIDQITNHTADNTQPVPFDQFSMLPDPDLNNPDPKVGGYSSLPFP